MTEAEQHIIDMAHKTIRRLEAEKEDMRQKNQLLRKRLDASPYDVKPRILILDRYEKIAAALIELAREVKLAGWHRSTYEPAEEALRHGL